jgi:hypothetical protein
MREEILYAEIDLRQLGGTKWMLDVAAHYARPDVFELIVHREARPVIASITSKETAHNAQELPPERAMLSSEAAASQDGSM